MIVTNFSLIDFENGNKLGEADLDYLFVGIHSTIEGMLFNAARMPLMPDSFTGENKIAATINNSLFSIDADGNIVLVSKQSLDDSVAAAAASAASALASPSTSATSTSSIVFGGGVKSLTLLQTGKNFVVGQWVTISDPLFPRSKWMLGAITAFNSGTGAMSVDVATHQGSGSASDWVIAASAPTNVQGDLNLPFVVSGTSQQMLSGGHYIFTNVGAISTAIMPPNPNDGDVVCWDNATTRYDMIIDGNGKNMMGAYTRINPYNTKGPAKMRYISSLSMWRFIP